MQGIKKVGKIVTKRIKKRLKRKINKNLRFAINRLRGLRARQFNRRRGRRRRNAEMPAAYTESFSKLFRIVKQDGNSMTVTGRDLVYSIPDNIVSTFQDSNIITMIPCNPCYWIGTRISAIANGYQNYRPLRFIVNYVPQCAVTQQGNVISGTIWNQTPSSDNIQQTLRTSSGGMLTQCYKSATSIVTLQSNLQFNLYRCAGKFDQESNPFMFMAMAVGCIDQNNQKIIPGYFYVTWEYTFKNPIGYNTQFYNSGLSRIKEMDLNVANTTIIAAQSDQTKGIETGMIIQVDKVDDEYLFTYNNSQLKLKPTDDLIAWCFSNKALGVLPDDEDVQEIDIYYETSTPVINPYPLSGGTIATVLNTQGNTLFSFFNTNSSTKTVNITTGDTIYLNTGENRKEVPLGLWREVNDGVYYFANPVPEGTLVDFIPIDDIEKRRTKKLKAIRILK